MPGKLHDRRCSASPRSSNKRGGRLARLATIALALLGAELGSCSLGEPPSIYYRVTTDLETEGRPFPLDVVVQCRGLEALRSGSGGRLSYKQRPYLYGRPTEAGHAVLMRVPDFCGLLDSGDKRAKEAVQRLKEIGIGFPLILWMPDKANFDRMTAYTSAKGYESPGSALRYGGTRFAEATHQEWQEWTKREGKLFVTQANDPLFTWDKDGRRNNRSGLPLYCAGLRLKPIPSGWKEEVRRAWPADRPLVWTDAGLWKTFTSAAFQGRPENHHIFQGPMWFVSTQLAGFDTLPYEVRLARAADEPIVAAIPGIKAATIHTINLDVTARGRAECRRAADAAPEIWIAKSGNRTGQIDRVTMILIADEFVFTAGNDSRIQIFEGSHEDVPP